MRYLLLLVTFCLLTGATSAQLYVDQPLAEINSDAAIHKVEWHPDGEVLAAATSDGVLIYNTDLRLIDQQNPETRTYSLSWNPSGNSLAVTNGQNIEIWNWNGETLTLLETLEGEQTQLNVLWSPSGTYIASADSPDIYSASTYIRFWNTTTWSLDVTTNATFIVETDYPFVDQMVWNPDGTSELLFLGDQIVERDGSLFVGSVRRLNFIDATTGSIVRSFPHCESVAIAAAWRPQDDTIAIGCGSGHVLYNATTGDIVPALRQGDGFESPVFSPRVMDWTSDGRYLATNHFIYDFAAQQFIGNFGTLPRPIVVTVDWHPDDVRLVMGDSSGGIRIEDASLFHGWVAPDEVAD